MHICFSSHCIVLFPLRTPASWRRLFKVWRNWPNSKLICYSERGEPRLSFEYKFVGHPWKLLKLYPTVDSYLFFSLYAVLYCFHWDHRQVEGVRSAHGGSLRYEGIGQIQNWYVILKGENLGFHLNINLSATLENLLNRTNAVLYCFHWDHRSANCTRRRIFKIDMLFERGGHRHSYICRPPCIVLFFLHWDHHEQVERVRSAHGGSLRYEWFGQIQNWYVILKGESLGFHLNINLSATLQNF